MGEKVFIVQNGRFGEVVAFFFLQRVREDVVEDVAEQGVQNIVLRFEMRIESRSRHLCFLQDILDGNGIVASFFQALPKGVIDGGDGFPYAFVHAYDYISEHHVR